MIKNNFRLFFFCVVSSAFFTPPAAAEPLHGAVVKIFVTQNPTDYFRPWQTRGSQSTSGSGAILDGRRIITNAHVVDDHTFIQVRKESDPKKYTARLEAIGHDCDLAILTVDDPEFFKGTNAAQIGNLPLLKDTVSVLGFPLGGDKISVTEGVVSRIEVVSYSETTTKLLAVQIDAAINPGNSGGPVFQDGKMVGIAMQHISNSQNIGYMIPTPVINHFLADLGDAGYDGFPVLGIDYVNTESRSLRAYYGLDDKSGGVLVSNVYPFSSAAGQLQVGDIILELDGIPVGMDGTFPFRENERLVFSHLLQEKQIGEMAKLKILREKKNQEINLKLINYRPIVPLPKDSEKPSYYVYGGLVFTVLTTDLLQSWGTKWWEKAPLDFLDYLIGDERLNRANKREIVVMLEILPDDINTGYHDMSHEVISKFNGKTFSSFREFVEMVENNKDAFAIFESNQNEKVIIKNDNIRSVTRQILDRNAISQPYSRDVMEWLNISASVTP